MNELLKSSFTSDEIKLAASIGAKTESLENKIVELYKYLNDPLLSPTDVHSLLAVESSSKNKVCTALENLVDSNTLEFSNQTLRPFDSEGIKLYRLQSVPFSRLKLIAIESELGDNTTRFQFTCDGRTIRSFARIHRLDSLANEGNQREEIHKHVKKIAEGIRSGNQIPNSVLLVFLKNQVKELKISDTEEVIPESFIIIRPESEWINISFPHDADKTFQRFRSVSLDIPYRRASFDGEKFALLVDGQQRTAALSLVDIDEVPHFSLSVNAVQATPEEAKKVFAIANNTVKISTEFLMGLLATMPADTDTDEPVYLAKERDMAIVVKMICLEMKNSPFYNLAVHPGVKYSGPKPPIAYNSLFAVVQTFHNSPFNLTDSSSLADAIVRGFEIVKNIWPTEWARKPADSKLMHGVGLKSVSRLIISKLEIRYAEFKGDLTDAKMWDLIKESLERLKDLIVWSNEAALKSSKSVQKIYRDEIGDYQNTNQDIERCSNLLREKSLAADAEATKNKLKNPKTSRKKEQNDLA